MLLSFSKKMMYSSKTHIMLLNSEWGKKANSLYANVCIFFLCFVFNCSEQSLCGPEGPFQKVFTQRALIRTFFQDIRTVAHGWWSGKILRGFSHLSRHHINNVFIRFTLPQAIRSGIVHLNKAQTVIYLL